MARGTVNKSQAIRETFDEMGRDARPKDVVAALASKGIKVSPNQVSMIKAKLTSGKRPGRRGRPARAAATANGARQARNGKAGEVPMASLVAAKRFIEEVGSIDEARRALEALAALRG